MFKVFVFSALALFFIACAPAQTTLQKASDLSKQQPCYRCDTAQGFEAKIKGLLYISDIGLQCCADKRTLDPSSALKKVYFHRIDDLSEEKKLFFAGNDRYFINEQFNVAFYVFLKQELEARGIIVVEGINNSPYVLRLDLSFIDFNSKLDATGLHSNISGRLTLKNINMNKQFVVRTKQDVMGFSDAREISFYTFLLIKQMANKTAELISAF
ncbi:hypothetical protein DMB95_01310 [Campylobacter sp. MIT 12-8780]|uniref:outer membrane lipoprotein MapA n=1 Tax=unclassified Campylobacter TaxID=2593542 RepID=UPI0010F83351|nr:MULTISPECIES: outer membrane lipoprotein MapA [unclassified Campylobacter]NDJ26599.1 hypothetical protein [Campylobacter sp. MIT 19-121]TKX29215.1 hypothetical protein CQA38_03800 [Campylobacter sp. MIT 12-5580]TQR43164.1 hypothetical protein DMB95_01310 [Campylobacter sp. MIT 12-8780]